eukprot:3551130-Prymnesium_polylepis.1
MSGGIIAACPSMTAFMRGVSGGSNDDETPLGSAPSLSRALATSTSPNLAAMLRGVSTGRKTPPGFPSARGMGKCTAPGPSGSFSCCSSRSTARASPASAATARLLNSRPSSRTAPSAKACLAGRGCPASSRRRRPSVCPASAMSVSPSPLAAACGAVP